MIEKLKKWFDKIKNKNPIQKEMQRLAIIPTEATFWNKLKYLFKKDKPNWFTKKEQQELEEIGWFESNSIKSYPVSWGEYTYTIIRDEQKIIKTFPASRNFKTITRNDNSINKGSDRLDDTINDYFVNLNEIKEEDELIKNLEKEEKSIE